MSSSPDWAELGVPGTSALSRTWTKHIMILFSYPSSIVITRDYCKWSCFFDCHPCLILASRLSFPVLSCQVISTPQTMHFVLYDIMTFGDCMTSWLTASLYFYDQIWLGMQGYNINAFFANISENSLRNGVGGPLTVFVALKPLWSGMGEVVLACTLLTLHFPSPPTML